MKSSIALFCFLLLDSLQYIDLVSSSTDWFGMAQKELNQALNNRINRNRAKNVILFIGDGMGLTTVNAARILRGQMEGRSGEEGLLEFEKFPHLATAKTYTNDRQVPDSAATATAFLCGIKTNAYTLGLNDKAVFANCSSQQQAEVDCVIDWFHDAGKSTGIVTTTRITHATPAAAYAKSASREWEGDATMFGRLPGENCTDIASQLIYNNPNIKVLLGGGRKFFLPRQMADPVYGYANYLNQRIDEVDLINVWIKEKRARGYKPKFVFSKQQFDDVDADKTDFLLGLFNPGHMDFSVDRNKGPDGEPSLAEMTRKAIEILQKDKEGYFLLVEGGRIDHAHHDNMAKRALLETLAFEDAVKEAVRMTREDDTLIIVSADHSHVFNIAGYSKRGNDILGVVDPIFPLDMPKDGIPYTTLVYGNGPGYEWGKRKNVSSSDTTHINYRQVAAVPLIFETHGGEDVPIYARGPMSHLFYGVHEQHYIAHAIAYAACVGGDKRHCQRTENVSFAPRTTKRSAQTTRNVNPTAETVVNNLRGNEGLNSKLVEDILQTSDDPSTRQLKDNLKQLIKSMQDKAKFQPSLESNRNKSNKSNMNYLQTLVLFTTLFIQRLMSL